VRLKKINKQILIDDLQKLFSLNNRIPTESEYKKLGKFCFTTVRREFGSWNKALLATFKKVNIEMHDEKYEVKCKFCGQKIVRRHSDLSENNFCNKSHAAFFNSKIRKGCRRSKAEILLFNLLVKEFPTIKFIPNDREMLNGYEVDIAVPEISLGIEWNGIIHFKPIYGQERLNNIQRKDAEKQKIAIENKINLIVIPDFSNNQKYTEKCFSEIREIIKQLISK